MTSPLRIIIIGNGFGGVYTLKNLHKYFCGNAQVSITLIGDKNYFLFTPLLHEVATGSINPENIVEPIRKVLGCCIDRFHLGKAENIDLENKTVEILKEKINYDYLVLAPGAETNFYNIPGAEEFTLTLKSLEDARKIKNKCILALESASQMQKGDARKKALSFAIVGGGATGVELAAELHEFLIGTFSHYYPIDIIEDISVTLIQREAELLPGFSKKLRAKSLKVLKKKGVSVLLQTEVTEVKKGEVFLNSGASLQTDTVIWVAGIKPVSLTWSGSQPEAQNGKLLVNEFLQLQNNSEVFALGDSALFKNPNSSTPLPALAQVAEKQAKAVAKNIKLLSNGKNPKPFYYKSSGSLVSVGQWMALGEILGISISGRFTWWVWRTVYLFKMISGVKKVKVAIDWTVNIFLPRDISQL